MTEEFFSRRGILKSLGVGAAALLLPGCDRLGQSPTFQEIVLSTGERLSYRMQRLLGINPLAREYEPSEMSPVFRTNGNTMPRSPEYLRHLASSFAEWRLEVDGRVKQPKGFSLAELKAMPARSQITRHDCVEGWSAIGKWTGVPLGALLDAVELEPSARYIVFHCADDFRGTNYYESIDLVDAFHPQTILAYDMNDGELPVGHGAPLRLRVERQLGYKQAKFVMRVEAVESLEAIGRGKGGYWEDNTGYEWYAGI
ncbi:molybdopterin-dependent oxidoreductase [Parvibaculum sp.]|uniref:molybdopterin-dependent oxidoreductase n=1 Tax=Parvibaculum sp. TaxID=2024848 RepID=UPI001B126843|nr:molybdopterin-dependent oxidoreductase [Parvibaculum sp.]MBO6668903.1 molybdopterin-dependent oxidoreductase [Parvibaculum sp.]MBO6691788.1 molybdopterin-dependent oxidoreductase [Parvibaculum sp.]MBO6715547.1 molybdopterin-dependent oxidoreductase [Parvibaculum sp.]